MNSKLRSLMGDAQKKVSEHLADKHHKNISYIS